MDIDSLFQTELGDAVRVFNEPFTIIGSSTITLEGGEEMVWLFGDNDRMLSVSPIEEELLIFQHLDDEVEPDGEGMLFRGKEYEFNYEDAGNVTKVEGESITELDDRYVLTDYRSPRGDVIRILNNENTGESEAYLGHTVSEEDLARL